MRIKIASTLFMLALAAFGAGVGLMGITNPLLGLALIGLGVILTIAAVVVLMWPRLQRITTNWRNPPAASKTSPLLDDMIPLDVAVMEGWEQLRTLPRFDEPQPRTEFNTGREYYESNPAKLASIAAELIFNSANPPIPIEGVYPPRTTREWIPEEIAAELGFSDDATKLFDLFDCEKPVDKRRRYIDLRVRPEDIERRIKQMGGKPTARGSWINLLIRPKQRKV